MTHPWDRIVPFKFLQEIGDTLWDCTNPDQVFGQGKGVRLFQILRNMDLPQDTKIHLLSAMGVLQSMADEVSQDKWIELAREYVLLFDQSAETALRRVEQKEKGR